MLFRSSSKSTKTRFLSILECIGCVRGKNSHRDSRGELLSINKNVVYIGPHGCDVFDRNEKVQKSTKIRFFDILGCLGCVRGENSLRDSRGELLSINANVGTRGCDVFDRNERVQKAPQHDFWTYWTVFGAFVAKTHIVIRAVNFCQLMPILADEGAMFLTGIKKFKKRQNMIFGHIGVYWVRSWQKLTS